MLHACVPSKGFPQVICINSLRIYEAILPTDGMNKLRFKRLINLVNIPTPILKL